MVTPRNLVANGTRVIVHTGGGGGWGDPLDRDIEAVRRDVDEGLVSLEAARDDYGVVIDPDEIIVDIAATEKLRGDMRTTAKTAAE